MAGVELATAYVSLVVEGSKVAPGVKSALGAADGEAARSGDRAGRSFTSKFGSALKIGATLGAAFAVTKGVQFLGDAIEEAREASVVTARTANVIESMGDVAGITAKQVADLSGAISNKVGIDDEAIQSGANLLLTFGNLRNEVGAGNDIFDQTTQLMVDMSAAMDQDMKSSAIQLGKALNDPIKGLTALSRVGVSFTEQQKEQIESLVESGETMKAQKVILGELKRQFGGAAESMTTPAEKAEVAWGNLKEQIGEKLLPTVNRVLDWFSKKAVPAVSKFVDQFDRGKGAGGEVRDVVEDIWAATEKAAGYAADFVGFFRDMPGWAQKALAGGAVAGLGLSKLRGGGLGGGGALGALGQAVGLSKPVPVFVTNPGLLGGGKGAPGVGGIPGGKGATSPGGKVGVGTGLGILAGGMAGLQYDPKDLGWEKLEGDLLKVNEAFVDIATSRTGIDNLTGATKALDGIIAGMTLKEPVAGFRYLQNLSEKTGISMADLRDVLPGTSKAIQDAGGRAKLAAQDTFDWKQQILGADGAVQKIDGKKPKVPFEFPGLLAGLNDTGDLGGKVDVVGRKKPKVVFDFPNLLFGVDKVWDLKTGIDNLHDKTVTIRVNQIGGVTSSYGGQSKDDLARASGGPIVPRTTYMVGERGPELFVSRAAGRIIPNHRLPTSSAPGAMTVNVYDVDNRLIGTMRGVVAENDRTNQRRLTAGLRT